MLHVKTAQIELGNICIYGNYVWIVLVALSRIFLQIFSRVRAIAVDLLFIVFACL